jgi:hypothetical protein
MTKKIKGDLVLTKGTSFEESIEVEGNIKGYFNLKVAGNINAGNINAGNINAWDIDARDIDARDINAWDIDARDINARNIDARDIVARDINAWDIDAWDIDARNINARNIIFCEKINRRKLKGKIKARILIENMSRLEQKEFD